MFRASICFFLFLLSLLPSCSSNEPLQQFRPSEFKGIAYIQVSRGSHISVLNLKTGEIGRILTGNKSQSISLSGDKKAIYAFSYNGSVRRIELLTGKSSEWKKIAGGVCNTTPGKTDAILITDPKGLRLLKYEPGTGNVKSLTSIRKGVCGIHEGKDGSRIYLTNRRLSTVSIINTPDFKIIEEIKGAGNSIHNTMVSPSGDTLWVAEGNEFRNGKPYGVGFSKLEAMQGGINIINLQTKALEDFIIVGGNVMDLSFSSDGKYAYVISSQMPEYDEAMLTVVNVAARRVVKNYSLCKSCHIWKGVKLPGGKAFVSALQVDEKATADSVKGALESGFFSSEPGGESTLLKQMYENAE